jgi:hypothetical protein
MLLNALITGWPSCMSSVRSPAQPIEMLQQMKLPGTAKSYFVCRTCCQGFPFDFNDSRGMTARPCDTRATDGGDFGGFGGMLCIRRRGGC